MSKQTTRELALGKANDISLDVVTFQINYLQGKILTLIEAVIPDRVQLKATKDIVKGLFSDQLMYVYQVAYPDTQMMTTSMAESIIDQSELPK